MNQMKILYFYRELNGQTTYNAKSISKMDFLQEWYSIRLTLVSTYQEESISANLRTTHQEHLQKLDKNEISDI